MFGIINNKQPIDKQWPTLCNNPVFIAYVSPLPEQKNIKDTNKNTNNNKKQ